MANLTTAQLETLRDKYYAALTGTLDRNAKSYSINGRDLESLSTKELLEDLKTLEAMISLSTASSSSRFSKARFTAD
jgi:hypothetical protein